ncbi:MAG: PEP-CTERM sorting domain-containing protein [Candidatus Acidiferrales bacterium]
MKKLLCVVPALLLFAMIGAPNARADSYLPVFTCTGAGTPCYGTPTAPSVVFSTSTPTVIYITAGFPSPVPPFMQTLTLSASDTPADAYQWFFTTLFVGYSTDYGDDGFLVNTFGITDETKGLTVENTFKARYGVDEGGSLMFSPANAAAPEPVPIILMLLGAVLIFLMRKRFVMRVPRIS